jgi:hypothetical protein
MPDGSRYAMLTSMDTVTAPRHAPTSETSVVMPRLPAIGIALGGALLIGVLTSVGQAAEPVLATMANSAGPWFVAAAALLLLPRMRLGWAMLLGVVLLELMHVGYWAATNLRGYPDSLSPTSFWVVMGVPAGLLAGAVATLVRGSTGRHPDRWRGAAIGVTAAILAGEGMRALLEVAATTSVTFWIVEIAAAVVLAGIGVAVARTPVGRITTLGTTLVGSAAVLGAFLTLAG